MNFSTFICCYLCWLSASQVSPACAMNMLTTARGLRQYNIPYQALLVSILLKDLRGDKYGLMQHSDKNKKCQAGNVGEGKRKYCKVMRTSSMVSLSSAGLQASITNYHIQTLFSCLAPLSTKCCIGKNNPQAEQQWEKNNRGCVIHPLLFVFHACFLEIGRAHV